MLRATLRIRLPLAVPTLAACLIIAFSSCTGGKPAEKRPADRNQETSAPDEGDQAKEGGLEGQESVMEDEGVVKEGSEQEGEDEKAREGAAEEKFVPTQERPLAPPTEPAAGAESLPAGKLGFAVSLSGLEPSQPLADGVEVPVADKLLIRCTVANKTEETISISFITAQKLDVVFEDIEGNTVYKWSRDKRFAQVVDTLELDAGRLWSHELSVDIGEGEFKLSPGTYTVRVMVTGVPSLEVEAADVVIIR